MAGGLQLGYVDSSFGQLHYAQQGSGEAILLLHQAPRSWDEFREFIPLLADDFRVVAMDMPGYGNSAPVPGPQTIETYARGAWELLDTLGVDRVTVIGHHTGAAVALEMAASRPERVARCRALVVPVDRPQLPRGALGTRWDRLRRPGRRR